MSSTSYLLAFLNPNIGGPFLGVISEIYFSSLLKISTPSTFDAELAQDGILSSQSSSDDFVGFF